MQIKMKLTDSTECVDAVVVVAQDRPELAVKEGHYLGEPQGDV